MAAIGLISVALLLSGCKPWVVVPLDENGQPILLGDHKFSAEEFVEELWQAKILPTVEEQAHDLAEVLAALASDPDQAKERYGYRVGTGPYNFLVRTEATVLSVDTTSRVGLAYLDLDPGDGQPDVAVQIGPVLRGTAIRDAMEFITFDLFTNQMEYAAVANKLNDRVLADSLSSVAADELPGKRVTLQGVLSLENKGDLRITPVTFAVGG